eukprot:superscaffoldBa00010588_g24787
MGVHRNTICSVFPDCRAKPDDYLSTILDLALGFGGILLPHPHVLLSSFQDLVPPHLHSPSLPTPYQLPCHRQAMVRLLMGLTRGEGLSFIKFHLQFPPHPGIEVFPKSSFTCHNLHSALAEPKTVDKLLAKEVTNSFMIGPFTSPPFPIYRISPIGITTRKYSSKKRLIIDLSSTNGTTTPSINSLIPSPDFSMHYAPITHTTNLICLAGHG